MKFSVFEPRVSNSKVNNFELVTQTEIFIFQLFNLVTRSETFYFSNSKRNILFLNFELVTRKWKSKSLAFELVI